MNLLPISVTAEDLKRLGDIQLYHLVSKSRCNCLTAFQTVSL